MTGFQYIGELCRYLIAHPPSANDRDHRIRFVVGNGLRPDVWPTFRDRFAIPRIHEFYASTEGNVILMNLDNRVGAVGRVLLKPMATRASSGTTSSATPTRATPRASASKRSEARSAKSSGDSPLSKRMALGRFEGYTSSAATEKKLLRKSSERGRAVRSGDLMRQDAQGYFYFVDRIGDTYRWKGENVSTQEVAELLAPFPGVHMANVYGASVEGAEGRAGMVALLLHEGARFDGERFYAFVSERLPRYACPAFVRIQLEADLTGTFKLRKVDLQKQGFDPDAVGEPLFARDDTTRSYVPLSREVYGAIRAGKWML